MKTVDHNKKYNSEHLVNQCKRDIFEFGENELVKMYLDGDIFYSCTLSRFDSKFGYRILNICLKKHLEYSSKTDKRYVFLVYES